MVANVRIGVAGWAIPKVLGAEFPPGGSSLSRYAKRFGAVEINSTFYRSHLPGTYARWAAETPQDFRFSVKLPKAITHGARLKDTAGLPAFFEEIRGLSGKLGAILIQLPPSLAFDTSVAASFFESLRDRWQGAAVLEPRHPSWFQSEAEALLIANQIGRVAASPALHPLADKPGGGGGLSYWRLHGSPRIYYSAYEPAELQALAQNIQDQPSAAVWCVFDNTASGAAIFKALSLTDLVHKGRPT